MGCRICGRGACAQSFHSIDEQEKYEEVLDAYYEADCLKEDNNKLIEQLEGEIESLTDEIEEAYERARELRDEINDQ